MGSTCGTLPRCPSRAVGARLYSANETGSCNHQLHKIKILQTSPLLGNACCAATDWSCHQAEYYQRKKSARRYHKTMAHATLSIGRSCMGGPGSGERKSTSQDPIQSAQFPMNASTAAKHIPRVFRESVVKQLNQSRRRCTACASAAEVQSGSPHSKNLKRDTLNRPTLTMWFGADKRPPVALSQAESIYKSSMYGT